MTRWFVVTLHDTMVYLLFNFVALPISLFLMLAVAPIRGSDLSCHLKLQPQTSASTKLEGCCLINDHRVDTFPHMWFGYCVT